MTPWKLLLKHELEDEGLDKSLNWPASILSAIQEFTPTRSERSFHAYSRWYDFSILPAVTWRCSIIPSATNLPTTSSTNLPPIRAVISAFSQGFVSEFYDPLQGLLTNPSEACRLYAKMLDSVIMFKTLAYKLICEFYSCVVGIIQCRLEDTEALLLACIVQGEVYRLLYTAACISQAKRSAAVRQALTMNSIQEALTSETTLGLEATVNSLRLLGASESPFEKVAHLDAAVLMINEVTADCKTRTKLFAYAIAKSKLATALAHTKLIEDFAGSRQSGLTVLREGVEELVQLVKLNV
jgi:hypothetical protein